MRAIIIIILFTVSLGRAYAMSCEPLPHETQVEGAEVIFQGTIIERKGIAPDGPHVCAAYSEKKPRCGEKVATFQVTKTWRGELARKVKVHSEDACLCLGSYFEKGKEYIVFAKQVDGVLRAANVCEGTAAKDSKLFQATRDYLDANL